jgi:large subunit ribosomal protein L25
MEKIILKANKREERGKQAAKLRKSGQLPGVIYGNGVDPTAVSLDAKEAERVYQRAGGNKIIQVQLGEGAAKNVLFHDVQSDGRTGQLIHADLYVVKMDEAIKTEIPLHYTGESTAVYQQEGTLLKNLETIEVEALPGNLPESIEVDISVLDDFEKSIHVSDLKIPQDVTLLSDPEELVAKVEPPRSEEELAELDEAPEEVLPEGVAEDQEAVREENEGNADNQPKPSEGSPIT